MTNVSQSFTGTGWSFPPAFDNASGRVLMVSDEEDIRQSLLILLITRKGERPMQPEFGCDLESLLLFEPLSTTLITEVQDLIQTAVTYFEPRVEVLSVDINQASESEGLLMIELEYLIRAFNSRFNLVLPFYVGEGVGNVDAFTELKAFFIPQ